MNASSRTKSKVSVSQHPNGSVILDPSLDQMFVTNQTGAEIVIGMSAGLSLDAIAEQISVAFNSEPDRVRRDVMRFVDELRSNGLLEGRES